MAEGKKTKASTEVEELDWERVDELIWTHISLKPITEIAKMAGVKPEVIMRRKHELVNSIDDLTIKETRQRLTQDLQRIARKTQEDYDAAPFEFKSGLMNSSVAAMKVILVELARLEKADTGRIDELNQKRVKELVDLVREVVDLSVVEIAAKHGLDEEELYDTFNRRMNEAAQKRDLS